MNILVFGVTLVIVALFLVNVAPVISESINNVDGQNPDIDDNAMNLARTMPFLIVIGVLLLLFFFWWRGGFDG